MKNGFVSILSFVLFFFIANDLFAFGKKQVEEKEPVNPEWTLCITTLDTSEMSPAWQTAGDTVTRSIAASLQYLDFRFRGEEETAYYRDYAWVKSRTEALNALVKKRDERDLLVFKGTPEWKYEKDLKAIDDAILKLEEALAEVDAQIPEVEGKPIFTLSGNNRSGIFPLPPKPGAEYHFCAEEKADAFLAGSLLEYHDRIYLSVKMYTRYTNSYSYENSVLFSPEDFEQVIDEISGHLAVAVSVAYPSAILVRSSRPESMILIDGIIAGSGEIEPRTHSPGEAEVAVHADNYLPVSIPLELNPGELAELFIDLTPLGQTAFSAEVPDKPGSKVFLGSLYMGETPLTLEIPKAESVYISVETPEGEIGSAIIRDNTLIRGNAQFTGNNNNAQADFLTSTPVSRAEQQVEKTRKKFYTAYGAFWIILPVALLASGIAGTYITANSSYSGGNPETKSKLSNNAAFGNTIQTASYGLIGASLGLTFFQIYRYLSVSGGDSTPIVKEMKE